MKTEKSDKASSSRTSNQADRQNHEKKKTQDQQRLQHNMDQVKYKFKIWQ